MRRSSSVAQKPKPSSEALAILKAAADGVTKDIAWHEKNLAELQSSVAKSRDAITSGLARLSDINDAIKALS